MDCEPNLEDEFYFQWHITERCNKSCLHCYQTGKPQPELPLSSLEAILMLMDRTLMKWRNQGSMSLTGGEPFVREDDLFALMRCVDETASFTHYDILTNGSLISDDHAVRLRDLAKLRRIQMSLEGGCRETNDAIRGNGSFEETLDAIRCLKKHGLTVSVMTTLSRLNFGEMPALITILENEGVDTLAMERLIPEGSGDALRDQLLSPLELRGLYEDVYGMAQSSSIRLLLYRPLFSLVAPDDPTAGALCSAGNNALTVMPDGTVYPCRRLPIPIGNVLEEGLFKIWYGSDVLWRIRNPEELGGKCGSCDLMSSCRGCRAMAYFATGDYMAEEPQCWR